MKIIHALDQFLKYPDKLTGFKNQAHVQLEKTNYRQAKRRFLFIIADSGGGHRATANAVKAAIEAIIPDACVYLMPAVDILNTPQRLFSRGLEEAYNHAIKMGTYWMEPFLFNSVYIMETPGIHDYIALRNAQIMHSFQPEAIVSFVPATQELSYLALKFLKKENEIPLYTVITDIVSMRHNWIMPEQAYSFVPTEDAKDFFVERGIAPEKMQVTGLPVHPRFYQDTQTREQLQAKYKLDPERFTILIIMGANGSKSIYNYCKLIESLNLPVQIIACCGTSHVIKAKVDIFAKISNIPIHVFGFTREIADLMKISDLMITKPGSVSIAEGISQNLPMMLDASTYIMWQEKGNDDYIEKHLIGKVFRSPDELAQKLTDLVNHREKYTAIKQRISDFPRQNAAEIIARHLVDAQSKP